MSHWVLLQVDGSDTEVVDVAHSFDDAVRAGRKAVTRYSVYGSEEHRFEVEAYDTSLAEALSQPPNTQRDVQFESGSASYDYRIVEVGE